MGFFRDLFGPRAPCDLCQLGQGDWPSDRSAAADWKLRGSGLNATLFICAPCRRLVVGWDLMERMPIFALSRMVQIGHARRPPVHAYLQHPEWQKIWMHMLENAGIRTASDFQALSAIAEIEAELFHDTAQESGFSLSSGESASSEEGLPDDALESALQKWVNAAGRKFVNQADLDDAAFQLASAWKLGLGSFRVSGNVEPQDPSSLRQQYRLNYPSLPGNENDAHFRGWIAGMKEIERQFLIYARSTTPNESVCTKRSIMARFQLSEEAFAAKYSGWKASLQKNGLTKNWNHEIDAFALANGFLTPEEVRIGRTNLEQAVLNRVKYASILNL
jgi:hypothetical protein